MVFFLLYNSLVDLTWESFWTPEGIITVLWSYHGCIFFWKILIFPKSCFMRCFQNSKTSSKFELQIKVSTLYWWHSRTGLVNLCKVFGERMTYTSRNFIILSSTEAAETINILTYKTNIRWRQFIFSSVLYNSLNDSCPIKACPAGWPTN